MAGGEAMFAKKEWKQNLLGVFEICLFMPSGVERFQNTRSAAIRSFVIPLALLPIAMFALVTMSEGFSYSLIVSLHLLRMIFAFAVFFTVVYFLCRQFDRQYHFYRFLNVANWSNVAGAVLTLPISLYFLAGLEVETLESYAVFITILGYIYSAFILTNCFKIPWEMGGFIAIVGLAIDQNLFDLTIFLRDIISA